MWGMAHSLCHKPLACAPAMAIGESNAAADWHGASSKLASPVAQEVMRSTAMHTTAGLHMHTLAECKTAAPALCPSGKHFSSSLCALSASGTRPRTRYSSIRYLPAGLPSCMRSRSQSTSICTQHTQH